jgi:hypothetical protein
MDEKALVKQGEFIMVLPSADRLGRSPLEFFLAFIKWVSLVMSADGNTMIFGHFDRPACINASHFRLLDFYGSNAFWMRNLISSLSHEAGVVMIKTETQSVSS